MADDTPFYAPNHPKAAPRQPVAGEVYAEFLVGHHRWTIELRDQGVYGIDVQFFQNEEFLFSRRFDPRLDSTRPPRELAIAWAEEERKSLERNES
jgi:hypothetical protein